MIADKTWVKNSVCSVTFTTNPSASVNWHLYFLWFIFVFDREIENRDRSDVTCMYVHSCSWKFVPDTCSTQRLCIFSAFFYGGVTPRDDPDVYLQCVEKCVQYYRELASPKPLVVNTMGWMKGLCLAAWHAVDLFYLWTASIKLGLLP